MKVFTMIKTIEFYDDNWRFREPKTKEDRFLQWQKENKDIKIINVYPIVKEDITVTRGSIVGIFVSYQL